MCRPNKRISGKRIKSSYRKCHDPGNSIKFKDYYFGAGEIGGICVSRMREGTKQADIIAFADNDKNKWNDDYMGYPIIAPERIQSLVFDYLVIASDKYYREFYLQIIELGVPREKVVNFDQFIVLMRY